MHIHQNTTYILIPIADISAAAAAFFGMTVHQVSLGWTVNNIRCVEVYRTSCLNSLTCLVLSWYVSLPWSTIQSISTKTAKPVTYTGWSIKKCGTLFLSISSPII